MTLKPSFRLFKRPADGLDPEARRAHEAWHTVRQMRHGRAAAPEWTSLKRRRARKRILRGAAAVLLLLLTGAGLTGLWLGGRAGFAWIRTHTDLLAVHQIVVTGTERLTPDEVVQAAGLALGDDILDVEVATLAARVGLLPQVRNVTARRTWKRQVILSIRERHPRALVLLDRLREVDDEGVILPGLRDKAVADLTIIRGFPADSLAPGTPLREPGLKPALDLIQCLARPEVGFDAAVSDIWAGNPDSLVMTLLLSPVPVRVGRGEIPPRRLMALRAVMEDLSRKKIEPEYVDLRFAGQVVVKKRPEVPDEQSVDKPKAAAPEVDKPKAKQPKVDKPKAGGRKPQATARGRRSRHGLNT